MISVKSQTGETYFVTLRILKITLSKNVKLGVNVMVELKHL